MLLEDYRDLAGRYDKLVSIEMIEAVGHQYLRHVLPRVQRAAQARRHDAAAGDHDRRPALRAGAAIGRLHPAPHLPRQLHPSVAAIAGALARVTDLRDLPSGGHRPALRDDARALAREPVRQRRAGARARLLRRVHPDVGVLLLLLRGRLRRARDRRRADAAGQAAGATLRLVSLFRSGLSGRPGGRRLSRS